MNSIINFALQNRLIIICVAIATMVIGSSVAVQLPIDVLPDLTRPRVVLITECPGLSPEEVERQVTFPLEAAVNGANGVIAVRSSSDIGLSVINVEFDWNSDVYIARQIVQSRISTVLEQLPDGAMPQMGPISSLLGQIMLVGMWSKDGSTDDLKVRELADWVVKQRLLSVNGISQVITMGGGKKQYHVLVNFHALHRYDVSLAEIEDAIRESNRNVTGGYLSLQSKEFLVRGEGRFVDYRQLEQIVVKNAGGRPVLLKDVATIEPVAQPQRGNSTIDGHEGVVLTIQKQPDADTRDLTERIRVALADVKAGLPEDVHLEVTYQQRTFIDHAVKNVIEALRDGAILVVVILFLFLWNFRTTFITLTAIPLSVVVAILSFRWFDMSINVMTLGGLAVAMGELVDDAIVDVENIFRRLRQNAQAEKRRPVLRVIYDASVEVRNAIIISTVLVIVVFAPLFALSGMAGRLLQPLGVAYIISIVASTVVSITVTPVLSFYLLPHAKVTQQRGDGIVLRWIKRAVTPMIRLSMTSSGLAVILALALALIGVSIARARMVGQELLPKFDEGALQVNLIAPAGTSLEATARLRAIADREFSKLTKGGGNPDGIFEHFTCKTGRAENDEHVIGVNISEYVISLSENHGKTREELREIVEHALENVPGIEIEVEQPIDHLISHLLSGVTAEIAIKIYGDNLDVLRRLAHQVKSAAAEVPGIDPPIVEQQNVVPQLQIQIDYDKLAEYGLSAAEVNRFVETAMNGRLVSRVNEGQRYFDVLLRFNENFRTDTLNLDRTPIDLPDGGKIPLSEVATVRESGGPNTVKREDGRRRIVVRVNTRTADLSEAVDAIKQKIDEHVELPEGYFAILGGQFEAQQEATRRILLLSAVAIAVVFVVLMSTFNSVSHVSQILFALPAAFVGGVAAMTLTGQPYSVASMVGFISLGGIAARNGLLLISSYRDSIEQYGLSQEIIVEGSLERLAPVLMTALTTGIGLLPIMIGGHQPGKEFLYPIATVITGGLVTSTLCEFLIRPGLFWAWENRTKSKVHVDD
ncbi:MAG: efflux RND transporter permease subunit [Planctomycetales bacterium]|nr:efflux RND transporter permease subunit [Planctomycetales bacterium]